jgi:serine/threonine-protein kinase
MDTDRNLLFAALALQAGLIDRDRFVQACTLWATRKDVPIADLLVGQGWLPPAARGLVEQLLALQMGRNDGDAAASLAAATGAEARGALACIADADIERSLAALTHPSRRDDIVPAAEDFATVPPDGCAGRNLLYEEIGRGGIGRVLRGRDPALRRDLAVKVLREEYHDDASVQRRFVEEAQIGGQLQHPGVVPVYELGRFADRRPFFTMKLVKGRTLAQLLKERPHPGHDQARFLSIFEQVCQTVAYAHSKGVIHRDLKPSNVMVGSFGEVQVMDWGLAKVRGSGGGDDPAATVAGTVIRTVRSGSTAEQDGRTGVIGTPAYMAPEQARGEVEAVGERADVFGLGAILCVILTGQPPFTGADREAVLRQAADGDVAEALGRLAGCGADAELVALCKDCLAPRREDRPRDAGAVAARVAAYQAAVQERLRQAELERAAAQARAVEERKRRRVSLALAAAVLLLVAGGGGGAWWAQQQRQARAAEQARRRQEADGEVVRAMGDARLLLEQAKAEPLGDLARFREARAAARRAQDVARTGAASEEVQRQAADLAARLEAEQIAAERDRMLLAALLEVRGPREGPKYRKDDNGFMTELAEPSADEQFAAAFRAWGLEVDEVATSEAAARLKGRPAAVVMEANAALDEWASERRVQKMPAEKWQRLAGLAAALDDPHSSHANLRILLGRGNLGRERALGMLSAALRPVPVPFDAGPGEDRARLRQLAEQTNAATEPVLGVLALARALQVAGDDAVAERLLRAAVRSRPREVVLYAALGHLLEGQRPPRWAEAAECYAAVRALRPELGVSLANALVNGGRVGEGLALYERLAEERKGNPWLHYNLGNALFHQGRHQKAEAAYRATIRLQPGDAVGHFNLGCALSHQGRYKEAEAAYREAIHLKPDYEEAHYNLGVDLCDFQHRYQEAEAAYRAAIRLKPDFPEAHNNLGAVLCDVHHDYKEAEAEFREVIHLKPDHPQAHHNLGNALSGQGRHKEAEAAYRAALRLKPDYHDAHFDLGVLLCDVQHRYQEAEVEFRETLRLKPDDPVAHTNLGHALRHQGRHKEAEAAYRAAIRLKPDYPLARAGLGLALQEQGRFAEAVEERRRGHELGSKAPGWRYPSADWVRQAERLVELDRRLPAVLRGEAEPASAAERVEFARLCGSYKRQYVPAYRLYAEAFAADPKLADDLDRWHRYNAACSAALAAVGRGEQADPLPDKAALMLRRQALRWLRADLAAYTCLATGAEAAARQTVRQLLTHWQQDSDLATVRDPAALDRLPDDERQQWRRLWDDVATLLHKVEAPK